MSIHLMQADVNLRNMARWSATKDYPDPDQTLHHLIYNTFGYDHTPKPFMVKVNPDRNLACGKLMGYTELEAEKLQEIARSKQNASSASVLEPSSIKTVRLPENWQRGTAVGFQTRVRPTYRTSHRHGQQKSMELDLYYKPGNESSREETYIQWLEETLRTRGATPVENSTRIISCRTRNVTRQHGRGVTSGPDALMEGTCIIEDPDLWTNAVRRGIGRHKAFGYGMLLLKPPGI